MLAFSSVNYFIDGVTLITKDEAPGSSVTAEEAKKVLWGSSLSLDELLQGRLFSWCSFFLEEVKF